MIPITFDYKRATSVDDALSHLNDDSKILAGGHSLIPTLKLRLDSPGTLIDISRIDGIRGIDDAGDNITIGAATPLAEIAASASLASAAPAMVQAASAIGDIQVRNKGTIGGSIAHADPAADWPAALLAMDASVTIQGKSGSRSVTADQFFKGFYETALEDGEIITSISIPKSAANAHSTYVKYKQPASRFAIVGCAVAMDKSGGSVRVGMTGVADHAYRATAVEAALTGGAMDEAGVTAAVGSVAEGVEVMSDHYASVKYRSHLAAVYAKRALLKLI